MFKINISFYSFCSLGVLYYSIKDTGIGENVQNGQTEPRLAVGYPKRRQNKADDASFCFYAKHSHYALFFLLPKKHCLLFGVPESRKTLRGKGANERQV